MLWPSGFSSLFSPAAQAPTLPRARRNQVHRCLACRCRRATAPRQTRQPAPGGSADVLWPPTREPAAARASTPFVPLRSASIGARRPTLRDATSFRTSRPADTTSPCRGVDSCRSPFGQQRPFEQGRPLDLGNGQQADKIDFALPRGGVIAGRVTDELGEPLAGVRVQAMRYQYLPDGRASAHRQPSAEACSDGHERSWGVPLYSSDAWHYVVSATPADDQG